MQKFLVHLLIVCLFLKIGSAFSEEWTQNWMPFEDQGYYESPTQEDCCQTCRNGHLFTFGPEIYYVKRIREGGTRQSGTNVGVRATYDYIKRYKFYVGAQAFYGSGILNGHTGGDDKIRSRFTDRQIEGVLGYTFQTKNFPFFSFTPFAGYGYINETTKFSHPSPLNIKLTTDYQYIPFGFLSSIMPTSYFNVGLNVRLRYLWDPKCKISDDPEHEKHSQLVEQHINYRIEVPMMYCPPIFFSFIHLGLTPFYEYRHYGGRENYPFDFFDTKLKIYGATLQLICQF